MIWCMFSMFGESNLVESFVFGQGRIQIPSLVCLFGLLTSKIYHVEGTVLVSIRILSTKQTHTAQKDDNTDYVSPIEGSMGLYC